MIIYLNYRIGEVDNEVSVPCLHPTCFFKSRLFEKPPKDARAKAWDAMMNEQRLISNTTSAFSFQCRIRCRLRYCPRDVDMACTSEKYKANPPENLFNPSSHDPSFSRPSFLAIGYHCRAVIVHASSWDKYLVMCVCGPGPDPGRLYISSMGSKCIDQ